VTADELRQEEDDARAGPASMVGLVALLVFAVATGAVWLLEGQSERALARGRPPARPPRGEAAVGLVEQAPFPSPRDALARGALPGPRRATAPEDAAAARLGSYGWVDRRAGLIHVPIERALELVLAGEGP
jgi:hypothetical protein